MSKNIFLFVILLSVFSCTEQTAKSEITVHKTENIVEQKVEPQKSQLELYLDSLGFVEIKQVDPTIKVDLKYATKDNFTSIILYKNLGKAYLNASAMGKLTKAQSLLKEKHPQLSLLVYDAARPLSVQKEMFDVVKNTKYRAYVANPSRTSLHNYGMAVDLTICDSLQIPLDMGTDFDYFGKLAGINNEEAFVTQGLLSKEQWKNRLPLRNIMKQAGFIPIRGEWWHFNAVSLLEAKRTATLIK